MTLTQSRSSTSALSLFQTLWNARKPIAWTSLAAAVAGLIVAFLIPSDFRSTAKLMPPDSSSAGGFGMLAAMGDNPGLGLLAGDFLGMKSSSALLVAVTRSRTVEDGLITRFNLQSVYRTRYLDRARKRLEENTEISEDKKSGIVTITVTDHDAVRARDMAEAYVELLNQTLSKASTSSARREREFLEGRLASVNTELSDATARLSRFSAKTDTIDPKEQAKSTVDAIAALQGQLMASQTQLRGLQEIYTDDNIRIVSLKARIAELENQVSRVAGDAGVSGIPSLRQLPNLGASYADLYRIVKVHDAVLETLTRQYELAKVQEAKEIPSVKYLDIPIVPERKSGPSRALIALTCALFGWLGGTAFVMIRYRILAIQNKELELFLSSMKDDFKELISYKK